MVSWPNSWAKNKCKINYFNMHYIILQSTLSNLQTLYWNFCLKQEI